MAASCDGALTTLKGPDGDSWVYYVDNAASGEAHMRMFRWRNLRTNKTLYLPEGHTPWHDCLRDPRPPHG